MIHDLKPYPTYKDSGIPWLGDVPEHWEIDRAKWLFQKMNRPVRPDDDVVTCFRDGVVTLRKNRRVSGFTESLKEIGYQGVRCGDLVIHAMDAFAGAIGVSDSDGKCTPVYAVCQPCGNANSNYYSYIVREMARTQWIAALAKGIRERSTDFRFDGFASQSVPIPPRQEQDQIVAFIDRIDRRIRHYIRAKKKLIKLLEAQKQAIIHQAVTRGLDPNVELKQSGVKWIEEIPKHWKIMRLGFLTHVIDPQPDHRAPALATGEGFPYVGIRDVNTDGSINVETARKVEETAIIKQESSFKIEENDIVFCKIGTLGFPRLIKPECRIALSATLVLIKTKIIANSHYLKYYLDSKSTYTQIDLLSTGSTRPALGIGQIRRILICTPPLTEQQLIVDFLDFKTEKIDTLIYKLSSQVEELKNYRTRLIADVVTGKLDVREAAASLPEETGETESLDDVLAEDDELESNQIEDEQAGELEDEVLA